MLRSDGGAADGGPEAPEQSQGRHATNVYYWDLSRLDELSARQKITCPACGERLSAADGEALIQHLLQHDQSPERRRELERALSLYRNWETLPEETRNYYRAQIVRSVRSDPAEFEQLQREGVVTKIAGKG